MDGVFRNNYWSIEEFFLKSKKLSSHDVYYNLNDSYCPYIINLMIFRCKSKKIVCVQLVARA